MTKIGLIKKIITDFTDSTDSNKNWDGQQDTAFQQNGLWFQKYWQYDVDDWWLCVRVELPRH